MTHLPPFLARPQASGHILGILSAATCCTSPRHGESAHQTPNVGKHAAETGQPGFVACKRCPGRLSNSVVGATSISLLIYCAQNLANPDHRTKARLILGANCEGLWNAACQLYHRPHLEAVPRLASSHVPASGHVQRWRGARAHVPRRGGNCRRRQRACRACPGRRSGQHRYRQRWAVEWLIPRRRAVRVPPLPAAHRVTLVPPAHVPCS